jgi:hypothetical protein
MEKVTSSLVGEGGGHCVSNGENDVSRSERRPSATAKMSSKFDRTRTHLNRAEHWERRNRKWAIVDLDKAKARNPNHLGVLTKQALPFRLTTTDYFTLSLHAHLDA